MGLAVWYSESPACARSLITVSVFIDANQKCGMMGVGAMNGCVW